MTIPKHADLIHAFADGKVVQLRTKNLPTSKWETWNNSYCPDFDFSCVEWRIKPDEPKKAVIATMLFEEDGDIQFVVVGSEMYENMANSWLHLKELDREVTLPTMTGMTVEE